MNSGSRSSCLRRRRTLFCLERSRCSVIVITFWSRVALPRVIEAVWGRRVGRWSRLLEKAAFSGLMDIAQCRCLRSRMWSDYIDVLLLAVSSPTIWTLN